MRARAEQLVPLLARPPQEVLFRGPDGAVTAKSFLNAARQLAAELPAEAPVLNLCRDRARFAIGFAASLLRGSVSLLTGERSPARLAELAARYPGLLALCDAPEPGLDLPCRIVGSASAEAASAEATLGPVPMLAATQPAAIVFTSGSTGEPVGHAKSWGALAARSIDAARRFAITPRRPAAIIGTVPPQHMYGFETTVLLPLHAAASSWCGPAFFPGDVQAALAGSPPARVLVTTPVHLRALLRAGLDLAPLARVISATAPLDAETAEAAERRWGTELWEIFGATEVGSIASRRTVAGEAWRTYPRVRLANGAAGVSVAAPHAAAFPLNDRVDLIDPTRLRLLGRRTDLVKLGGRRASLAGLTRILTQIDGVEDGVFVAPEDLDDRPGARLIAYVVAPDRTPGEILASLRAHVDPLFLPRRVIPVERLPRNVMGKLPAEALALLRQRTEPG